MVTFNLSLSITDVYGDIETDPKKKLDDLIHLAELCIEVLQQNEEFHAEVCIIMLWTFVKAKKVIYKI